MVRAILVTHGMLGRELLRAAERIYGRADGAAALSNEGCSSEDLVRKVREELSGGSGPIYVFVDVAGGSCALAAQAVRELDPRVRLVAGVNLPMILEFLHYRDRVSDAELLARVLSRGRDGVTAP